MRKIFTVFLFTSVYFTASGQNGRYVFLSKNDIRNLKVHQIKTQGCSNFFNPNLQAVNFPVPADPYFCDFYFKNGHLIEINDFYERVKYYYYDKTFAKQWSYERNNQRPKEVARVDAALKRSLKDKNGPLIKGWEIIDKNGFASEYTYKNKLVWIRTYVNDGEEYPTDSEVKFNYNRNGQLISAINRSNPYETLFDLFFYENGHIAGYYPARETISSPLATDADSIYNNIKIREISKLVSPSFNNNSFSKEIIKKMIEDSYDPVRADQVIIDGLPLNQFLKKINKSEAHYIVMEIADNYFLFYKMIN